MYIRRVKALGGGGEFNYQLVRSYREGGTVKKEVLVHLGPFSDTEEALKSWRDAYPVLKQLGRHTEAQKLKAKCERLAELTHADADGYTEGTNHRWYRDGQNWL